MNRELKEKVRKTIDRILDNEIGAKPFLINRENLREALVNALEKWYNSHKALRR